MGYQELSDPGTGCQAALVRFFIPAATSSVKKDRVTRPYPFLISGFFDLCLAFCPDRVVSQAEKGLTGYKIYSIEYSLRDQI
jgi:hypothetical protein